MQATKLITTAIAALAIAGFTTQASAECKDCGTVTDVKTIKKEGEASGVGAVAGGVLGGVIGHQVEKNQKSTTSYQVHIKMDDGKNRTFNFSNPTSYKVGDKVKVVDGKLVRQ